MVKLCCLFYIFKNLNIKFLKYLNNLQKIFLNNNIYFINKYSNYNHLLFNNRHKNKNLKFILNRSYNTISSEKKKNIEISKIIVKKIKVLDYDIMQYIIINPFDNRSSIAKIAKKVKGIYIFEALDTNKVYVGSSINLYCRVISYFMPSILSKADRYVLRYFKKYGFNSVKLTLYIMNDLVTVKDILTLEEYFIKQLSKNNSLNIETVPGSGYHKPALCYGKTLLWVKLSNSGNTLKLLIPSYN
jgi:GIY-YIG catalytic domain